MNQAAFFLQLYPKLSETIFCTLVVIVLARKCLVLLAGGLYQPRNMEDDDLLTIKDFNNDREGIENAD